MDGITRLPHVSLYEEPIHTCAFLLVALLVAVLLQIPAFVAYRDQVIKGSKHRYTFTIQVCDALGLSSMIVTGVLLCAARGWAPLWLWGVMIPAGICAGGGIFERVLMAC